jgi:hypothetical protein
MACPRGCTNGGGQVRAGAAAPEAVEACFDAWLEGRAGTEVADAQTDMLLERVPALLSVPQDGEPGGWTRTRFREREMSFLAQLQEW